MAIPALAVQLALLAKSRLLHHWALLLIDHTGLAGCEQLAQLHGLGISVAVALGLGWLANNSGQGGGALSRAALRLRVFIRCCG